MTEHIATFHTHLGAIKFHKLLTSLGMDAVMMPVPRKLSASCGTCVRFSGDFCEHWADEDLDSVYVHEGNQKYRQIFSNEEA